MRDIDEVETALGWGGRSWAQRKAHGSDIDAAGGGIAVGDEAVRVLVPCGGEEGALAEVGAHGGDVDVIAQGIGQLGGGVVVGTDDVASVVLHTADGGVGRGPGDEDDVIGRGAGWGAIGFVVMEAQAEEFAIEDLWSDASDERLGIGPGSAGDPGSLEIGRLCKWLFLTSFVNITEHEGHFVRIGFVVDAQAVVIQYEI